MDNVNYEEKELEDNIDYEIDNYKYETDNFKYEPIYYEYVPTYYEYIPDDCENEYEYLTDDYDYLLEEASNKLEELLQNEKNELYHLGRIMTNLTQEIVNENNSKSIYDDDIQKSFTTNEKWYYECDVCNYGSDKCKCMPCVMKVCDTVEYPIEVICPNSGNIVKRYVLKKIEYPRMFMI